jgi:hypothetical protein
MIRRLPDDIAGKACVFTVDAKVKGWRYAGDACDSQARAFGGEIAHRAVDDGALVVEENLARSKHARAPGVSTFVHGALPSPPANVATPRLSKV